MKLNKKQLGDKSDLLRIRKNILDTLELLSDGKVLADVEQQGILELIRCQNKSLQCINNLLIHFGETPILLPKQQYRDKYKEFHYV